MNNKSSEKKSSLVKKNLHFSSEIMYSLCTKSLTTTQVNTCFYIKISDSCCQKQSKEAVVLHQPTMANLLELLLTGACVLALGDLPSFSTFLLLRHRRRIGVPGKPALDRSCFSM